MVGTIFKKIVKIGTWMGLRRNFCTLMGINIKNWHLDRFSEQNFGNWMGFKQKIGNRVGLRKKF